MKEKAATTLDKPNQIFIFTNAEVPDEVKIRLPSADTCKRSIRRNRALHRPRDPQNLQELEINGEWTMTSGENPVRFLLHDNGTDSDERVIIFATEAHLQELARSEKWSMDGNFAMAPHIFMQLYVIQGFVSGCFLPLAYVLLQRKTQTSYEVMFRIFEEHGCDPSTVLIDFEKSVENALHSVFGKHVQVKFCFYHLTQSTWRRIQTLGLANLYQDNENFRLFCGQLDGLALLPVEEVREGMLHLRDIAPEEANPLVEYFDKTYVSGQLRLRNAPQQNNDNAVVRFRRVPPLFDQAKWNVHDATLQGEPRTNNVSEGFNNKFFSLVGHQHPSIWKLIECLKAETARVTGVLLQLERGIRPKKRTKRVYVELQARLKNLCEDRVEGRKTVAEFLRAVSHNIRAGQPNI